MVSIFRNKFLIIIFIVSSFFINITTNAFFYQVNQVQSSGIINLDGKIITVEVNDVIDVQEKITNATFLSFLKECEVNFYILKSTYDDVNYIYSNDEKFTINVSNGRSISLQDCQEGSNVALVSSDRSDEIAQDKNTSVISKNSLQYEVIGITKEESLSNQIYLNLVFALNSEYPFSIIGEYYINAGESTELVIEELRSYLKPYGLNVYSQTVVSSSDAIKQMFEESKLLLGIVFIIVLAIMLNAINSTYYWLVLKSEELSIRRLVGATKKQITFRIIKEYSIILIISFLISSVILNVLNVIFGLLIFDFHIMNQFISFIIILFLGLLILAASLYNFYKKDLSSHLGGI